MKNQINILGVSISNKSKKNILEYLFQRLKSPHEKTFIITPNPEMLVYASKHLDYQDNLNSADVALPDGVGLTIAAQLLGNPLHERITGVDFIEELCKVAREKTVSIGFLGGKTGVAERAAECLLHKYPYLRIVFADSEWREDGFRFGIKSQESGIKDQNKMKTSKLSTTIDILFVAFGVPKQEEWIVEHLPQLPVKAAMGVGGALDFLSGNVRRAPLWIRKMGLEWLFRLVIQPWRWKRQLALIAFIGLVLKQKFSK